MTKLMERLDDIFNEHLEQESKKQDIKFQEFISHYRNVRALEHVKDQIATYTSLLLTNKGEKPKKVLINKKGEVYPLGAVAHSDEKGFYQNTVGRGQLYHDEDNPELIFFPLTSRYFKVFEDHTKEAERYLGVPVIVDTLQHACLNNGISLDSPMFDPTITPIGSPTNFYWYSDESVILINLVDLPGTKGQDTEEGYWV